MDLLVNFFTVRPVFTLYGLRVVWGAYLISQVLPFVAIVTNPNFSTAALVPLLAAFLQACVNVTMFRLIIEVAAAILLGRPTSIH